MTAAEIGFLAFTTPGTKEKISIENPLTVASAAGLNPAPVAFLTTVSGALAMNLITLPWDGFSGLICVIPTGAFTGALGGVAAGLNKPIGKAFTAVVGQAFFLVYSPKAGLWYPTI